MTLLEVPPGCKCVFCTVIGCFLAKRHLIPVLGALVILVHSCHHRFSALPNTHRRRTMLTNLLYDPSVGSLQVQMRVLYMVLLVLVLNAPQSRGEGICSTDVSATGLVQRTP